MRRHSSPGHDVSTRDLILDAAVLRFSRHSYEEAALRDIATDVGVDVAYVHRCFGSKERLFSQALAAVAQSRQPVVGSGHQLARALAREAISHDAAKRRGDVGPLDIVIHSLSSPGASQVLREFILKDFIKPIASKLDHPAGSRASLIAAFLTGLGVMRKVLSIDPLTETRDGALEHLVAHVIQSMMDDDLIAPRARSNRDRMREP